MNFNYKLFAGKHVIDIVLPNILNSDESNIAIGENMIDVFPMLRPIRNHILKVLMQEANALQEIIVTSTNRKGVVGCLIQMQNPKIAVASFSQTIVLNNEKDVETLDVDEGLTNSDVI